MEKLERLEFAERQCRHALALIRESERTYDRNWARRLIRMADDLVESIAMVLHTEAGEKLKNPNAAQLPTSQPPANKQAGHAPSATETA